MIRCYIFLLISILLYVSASVSHAQVFLQLEYYDNPVSTRFFIGDYFMYQTQSTGKKWFHEKIEVIDYQQEFIYFSSGMVSLNEITRIKLYKKWAKGFGDILIRFGAGWFAFAAVTHFLNDNWNFGADTAAIGGGAIILGFLMKKVVATKSYNVKKQNRLRIIDVNWPDPVPDH
ncbi:MAG TPA: hypothetical protein PKC30_12730 [Saprospiraceae bacterium]|nr:hypothetical protein [Saprospiraceae bacterium]